MNEEPLDIHRFGRAVTRAKWTVVAFVVAGLLGAALYSAVRSPRYTASTVVLLPPSARNASGLPSRDPKTEIQLAMSDVVLTLASKALPGVPPVDSIKDELSVSAPTPDILAFKGRAGSAQDAIAVSNAGAAAYRTYSSSSATDEARQIIDPLNRRIGELRASIDALQRQITDANRQLAGVVPNSPKQLGLSAQLAQWSSQQQDALKELQADRADAAQALADSNAVKSIKVISPATTASNGIVKTLGFNLLAGALVGLLLGVTVVIARDSRDRALRLRSEIAAAAGVPAVASLAARNARKPTEWLAILENYQPNPDEQWGLRKLLRAILAADASPPANVAVVSLASDEAALAVAPQLACFAAGSGLRTVLIVDSHTPSLRALHQVRDVAAVSGVQPRENLSLVEEMPEEATEGAPPVDLTIRMLVAGHSGLDLGELPGATTLLAVSAGAATPDEVEAVAAAAAEANAPLAGIVVANPEPGDISDGTVSATAPGRVNRIKPASGSAS